MNALVVCCAIHSIAPMAHTIYFKLLNCLKVLHTPLRYRGSAATISGAVLLHTLILGHISQAQAQKIYRCGTSYSDTPCLGAKVVPIEDVPLTGHAATRPKPSLQHSKQEAAQRKRTEQALDKAENSPTPKRSNPSVQTDCEAAERRINKIDALARRGGSAKKMEQLREDRKATRDKQFRWGC